MASIAEKIAALDAQRECLGARCAEYGFEGVSTESSLNDIMRALYKRAYGWDMQFSPPYVQARELRLLREIMAESANKIYGTALSEDGATLPEIEEAALAPLAKPTQAYAVAVEDAADAGKYALRFLRAEVSPAVGDEYKGGCAAYVYEGFEEATYMTNSKVPWYAQHADITHVVFDDEVCPKSCAYWFYWMSACTSFSLNGLDTSEATSFAFMFYSCTAVTTLNLSMLATPSVTSINYMFYNCTKLQYLYFGRWDMTNLQVCAQAFRNCTALATLDMSQWTMPEWTSTMQYMFYNCNKLATIYVPVGTDMSDTSVNSYCFSQCSKLVGGAGTAYSSANVTAVYARVDGLGGKPGYFTGK